MTKGDSVVLAIVLVLLPFLYVKFWASDVIAERVEIVVNHSMWDDFSLHEDRQIKITGVLGESEIVIKNGKVRFTRSPCHRQLCIYQGWSSRINPVLVCIPNQISVAVVGLKQGLKTAYDSYVF